MSAPPTAGFGPREASALDRYEPVIGLEIHVQLDTATKMFCADANEYGAPPNTHVCPVCLGLPGALPVVNGRAVELAVRAALALGCTVHGTSVFARKNYFYPDLPKGYQITQYERPLATGGFLALGSAVGVRVRRVHLEEDAGKSLHDRIPGRTAIDLNRAGVPLIEIVTEPDLRSPAEARGFLVALKRTLEYLGVSDCDMEKGSLRVDANLSVRPRASDGGTDAGDGPGDDGAAGGPGGSGRPGEGASGAEAALGTKTEVKNLNSFSAVERALAYEAERQARVLAGGGAVEHETRLWDADADATRPMRGKEAEHDYRYFPEPDLPPVVMDLTEIEALRDGLPELPDVREDRFVAEYELPPYDAGVLTAERATADWFEALAEAAGDPKAAANWVMGEVMAWRNQTGQGIDAFPVAPDRLGALIRLAADGTVSSTAAKEVFARMVEGDERDAATIVADEGLAQVRDTGQLDAWVDEALAAHPDEADRLRGGETKLLGFFVGAVMRASGGKADPERVKALLRERVAG